MKVKTVLIVGGGSAGWMTAAALTKFCPHLKVDLIESPIHSVIGVGESTLAHIRDFFQILEVDEKKFLKETGAIYKVGIRFHDFYKKGESWTYPFGQLNACNPPTGLSYWFHLNNHNPKKYPTDTCSLAYEPTGWLSKENRFPTDESRKTNRRVGWDETADIAYHLDAVKTGEWFSNNLCDGVTHHIGIIDKACKKDNGEIESLVTTDGRRLSYDLYVDCSGFNSILLEKEMKSKWISYNVKDGGCFANDRAITCQIPHTDPEVDVKNTTECTALDNGWVWDVSLWERSGVGYVHSSSFVDKEAATEELYDYIVKTRGHHAAARSQFRTIDFRNGKHEKSWVKNVCGVGLANCFIEPLEATGIHMTHQQIVRLCSALSEENVTASDIAMVNKECDDEIETIKGFVASHFAFSARDTDYWKYISEDVEYDFDNPNPKQNFFARLRNVKHEDYIFTSNDYNLGLVYVAGGMHQNPITNVTSKINTLENNWEKDVLIEECGEYFDDYKETMLEWVRSQPSTYQYFKEYIHD